METTVSSCFLSSECVRWSHWHFSSSLSVLDLSFWSGGTKGKASFRTQGAGSMPLGHVSQGRAEVSGVGHSNPPWSIRGACSVPGREYSLNYTLEKENSSVALAFQALSKCLPLLRFCPDPLKTFVFISSRIVCKEKQGQDGVEARRTRAGVRGKAATLADTASSWGLSPPCGHRK